MGCSEGAYSGLKVISSGETRAAVTRWLPSDKRHPAHHCDPSPMYSQSLATVLRTRSHDHVSSKDCGVTRIDLLPFPRSTLTCLDGLD